VNSGRCKSNWPTLYCPERASYFSLVIVIAGWPRGQYGLTPQRHGAPPWSGYGHDHTNTPTVSPVRLAAPESHPLADERVDENPTYNGSFLLIPLWLAANHAFETLFVVPVKTHHELAAFLFGGSNGATGRDETGRKTTDYRLPGRTNWTAEFRARR